jgi:hypothetical protein
LLTFKSFLILNTITVPVYDGRKRQLKIPNDLRNIPAILSRYPGNIPYHSLVLVAYTVSMYRSAHGSRKDQPTVPLNISFAVVLHDKPVEFIQVGNEGSQDVNVVEEDGDEDRENQDDESMQISSAEEDEDQDDEEDDDQSEYAEADLTDVAVDEHSDDE